MPFRRYPVSTAILVAALAATAAVFAFARPQFERPAQGSELRIDLSKYPAAAKGWTWEDGQPGFRFGDEQETWNLSQVKPAELAPARAAARRWGVAPASVRLLTAIRLGPHDLSMIVAGTNAADRTCLGFVRPGEAAEFVCGARLARSSAFVLVTTRGPYEFGGRSVHPTFLTGIARGDVSRVVVDQPPDWRNAQVFDRAGENYGFWGTFELSLSDSRKLALAVHREGGQVTEVPVQIAEPGDLVLAVPTG